MPIIPARRWFQFRLSTILMLTAIAALSVAHFGSTRRVLRLEVHNRELMATNSKLRAEIGQLEVADPSKVVALRIPALDDLTWRWKVWLPKGNWKLGVLTQDIPSQGMPGGATVGEIEGGHEVPVSVTVRKGADGRWRFRAYAADAQIGNDLNESHRLIAPFVAPQPLISESIDMAGDKAPEAFDPKQPVVLIRLRAQKIVATPGGGWQAEQDPQHSDGVMVWFERTP